MWKLIPGAAENLDAFRNYYFRPRVLRDVTNGSTETTFMGVHSTLPIFISPAAMAKLGHPLGEVNLTKGAGECGIVQGVRRVWNKSPKDLGLLGEARLTPVDIHQRELQSGRDHVGTQTRSKGLLPGTSICRAPSLRDFMCSR